MKKLLTALLASLTIASLMAGCLKKAPEQPSSSTPIPSSISESIPSEIPPEISSMPAESIAGSMPASSMADAI